ncbi:hypothetical protein ACLB2K_045267 [Fragaria x ananassa]
MNQYILLSFHQIARQKVLQKVLKKKNLEEDIKTMKFVTSLSKNKEIKESLDSLNPISNNPILGLANDNPLDPITVILVQGSVLLKDMQSLKNIGKKSPRIVTGVAMEENNIVMDTMARNVKVSLGGENFTIKILWQCEGQTADLLIGNDFLLQQTKSPAKSGDYKPILLLQEQLKGHSEILVNEATSSEDSDSEENSEYQISNNESSDGEEEYIREHNLKLPEEGDLIILQTDANDYYWTGVVLAIAPDTNNEKICDKNYLPDALTREMTMFEREGRNPRSRKPVSEEKKIWERYKSGDKTVGPLHDGPDDNGRPNQSIPWMKAMTIANIKDVVLRDYDSSILASREKIMVTCYNHPPLENCDFFTALMRKEVDCTLATTTWLEKVKKNEKYKISHPFDSDLDDEKDDTACDWENSGPNFSAGYEEDPEEYHNIVNMLEK